jgi:hypothetical protein
VSLQEKKPSGCQWSPDFCCMTPPIWVSEASVAKESSAFGEGCWNGTAATRRRLASWKASWVEAVHSNVLAPPFRRSVKGFNTLHSWAKNSGRNLPCRTLHLFDVLRAWAIFYFGGVIGHWGRPRRRNLVSKNFKGGCCKNTLFQIDGEAIGG